LIIFLPGHHSSPQFLLVLPSGVEQAGKGALDPQAVQVHQESAGGDLSRRRAACHQDLNGSPLLPPLFGQKALVQRPIAGSAEQGTRALHQSAQERALLFAPGPLTLARLLLSFCRWFSHLRPPFESLRALNSAEAAESVSSAHLSAFSVSHPHLKMECPEQRTPHGPLPPASPGARAGRRVGSAGPG